MNRIGILVMLYFLGLNPLKGQNWVRFVDGIERNERRIGVYKDSDVELKLDPAFEIGEDFVEIMTAYKVTVHYPRSNTQQYPEQQQSDRDGNSSKYIPMSLDFDGFTASFNVSSYFSDCMTRLSIKILKLKTSSGREIPINKKFNFVSNEELESTCR